MDFNALRQDNLCWLTEIGIGYFEVTERPYDQSYFEKYVSYEDTPMATALNAARVNLVTRHYGGTVVDIGIGSGSFIRAHGDAYGYDINPAGVDWLHENGLYCEPKNIYAATFWDSFEHIKDPATILDEVSCWVFMSVPLFDGMHHVMRSKHYRKDEHYWYFTYNGLCKYMKLHGFEFVHFSRVETELGREDIGSFVFKRST
jgi:hypothetical protein